MRSCNLDAKKTMNSLMNCCSSWLAWLFCYTNLKMQRFTVNNGATSFPVRGSFIWLLCNATESGIIFLHTLHAKPPCIIELISHLIYVTKLQNSCVVIVNIIGHKGGKHCVSILDDFGSKWDSTPTLLRHSLCGCVVHGVKWLVREGELYQSHECHNCWWAPQVGLSCCPPLATSCKVCRNWWYDGIEMETNNCCSTSLVVSIHVK
jgi:hypothetical protein